jgi:hypothetical protein
MILATNLVMISMGHFYGPKNNKNNWAKDGDPGREASPRALE